MRTIAPVNRSPRKPSRGCSLRSRTAVRLPETPAVHQAAVKVEPSGGFEILKRVVRAQLPRRGEAGNKTGFLAVDQRMRPAVPRPLPSLNESEQIHHDRDMKHIVNDVLKPPRLDDLLAVDVVHRVVSHEARLVRIPRPW